MPIYQYKCSDCSYQMEALQKMSDPVLTDCPQCELPSLRKQLTAAAFKLNGTGWYETDFKNSGSKPKASDSNSADSSANSTSANTKSETQSSTDTTAA